MDGCLSGTRNSNQGTLNRPSTTSTLAPSNAANNVGLSINRVYCGNLVFHFLDTLSRGKQASCCHFFQQNLLFSVWLFLLALVCANSLRNFRIPLCALYWLLVERKARFNFLSCQKKRKKFSVPFVMF